MRTSKRLAPASALGEDELRQVAGAVGVEDLKEARPHDLDLVEVDDPAAQVVAR